MRKVLYIVVMFLALFEVKAQDTLIFDSSNAKTLFNTSIANHFSILEDAAGAYQVEDMVDGKYEGNFNKIETSMANLDFTTSTYWIHFVLVNNTGMFQELVLETARPITNEVTLFEISEKGSQITIDASGDGINFGDKQIKKNKSLVRIYLPKDGSKEFWLKLSSDGEIISLPIIFWEKEVFESESQTSQFFSGIFYGIFLFVILIYATFYVLLKDVSFLIYIIYVFCSGLLQFCLDGYAHQYLFPGGGYFTQHSVLLAAGLTVVFVVWYMINLLKVKEVSKKLHTLSKGFMLVVASIMAVSLIPGKLYEISYPLINGFSLLSTLYVLYLAFYLRYKGRKVPSLVLVGVFALILGAVIFILGNFSVINAPSITQVALKVGTMIEIICLSIVMAGKYKELQQEKEAAQAQLLVELEGINARLEVQVKERTAEIELQKEELELKNKDILSSIKYAERIQRAILPSDERFKTLLPDSFVLYKPRDIVSGDFYWVESLRTSTKEAKELIVYATADCTGHGVPGAFVSIIGSSLLKLSKSDKEVNTPAEALAFVNAGINETFNSEFKEEKIRDGMDIALCAIDFDAMRLGFAGAKNPAYIIRNGELIELKADKHPIGYVSEEDDAVTFTDNSFDLQKGDVIYTFSDGFADQFGGPKGKKYMYKKLKDFLIEICHLPMEEQKSILDKEFMDWRGALEQLDDVLIIGVRIN